jgi:hypothetical protein
LLLKDDSDSDDDYKARSGDSETEEDSDTKSQYLKLHGVAVNKKMFALKKAKNSRQSLTNVKKNVGSSVMTLIVTVAKSLVTCGGLTGLYTLCGLHPVFSAAAGVSTLVTAVAMTLKSPNRRAYYVQQYKERYAETYYTQSFKTLCETGMDEQGADLLAGLSMMQRANYYSHVKLMWQYVALICLTLCPTIYFYKLYFPDE